jgi:sec-independent protein translocase protein TatA
MFEGLFQPAHLVVILAIALLVFGPKRLPELGKGVGEAIRGFRSSVTVGDATSLPSAARDDDASGSRP